MKTLIKIIIVLFFVALLVIYIFVPAIGYGKDILMPKNIPWFLTWFLVGHVIFGFLICIAPILFIFDWINENIK